MDKDEIERLWQEYRKGPDYANVKRWFIEKDAVIGSMKWLFRSAILCATDPAFLRHIDPPAEQDASSADDATNEASDHASDGSPQAQSTVSTDD